MRVLVVGNGAREDALSWRLASSASCSAVVHAPGNAGTATRGENWAISATDGKALTERAKREGIELAVLGPETAIAAGVGDRLRDAGIPTFGPGRSSGRLESSKVFSKRFMERHGIPTAKARVVRSFDAARQAIEEWEGSCVIKADGLAAGKGVVVAPDAKSAAAVINDWYANNRIPGGGSELLLEECLEGREVSVFALCDGRAMVPFAAACDYKRAGDGDTGPNTGGMGAYSPPAAFPLDYLDVVREQIIAPTLRGLLAEGETYIGVLYCGLMWTASGPYVIEYNARFGDPETQVLIPRINGDFARLLATAAEGAVALDAVTISRDACVGVTIATKDYPRTSAPLRGLAASFDLAPNAVVFWGNSTPKNGLVDAAGGRVLTVTATAPTIAQARAQTYEAVARVGAQIGTSELTYRSDIAAGLA
ncbi:MAG TPA: phosphoribosylamine--glycine ligase [Candidatus Binatia bacterium]|nr:phosphoribosylamine--glycine ligase [Candidatus Binatia bacterium]